MAFTPAADFWETLDWAQACACSLRPGVLPGAQESRGLMVAALEKPAMGVACKECRILVSIWQAIRSLLHDDMEQEKVFLDGARIQFPRDYDDSIELWTQWGDCWSEFKLTQTYAPLSMPPKQICEDVQQDFGVELKTTDRIALVTENPEFFPKRVLCLENDTIKLLEDCKIESWVCLSYCWGKMENPLKLTHETLADFKNGVSPSALPCLFKDAITVCAWFGSQSLWIDVLCTYTRYFVSIGPKSRLQPPPYTQALL